MIWVYFCESQKSDLLYKQVHMVNVTDMLIWLVSDENYCRISSIFKFILHHFFVLRFSAS